MKQTLRAKPPSRQEIEEAIFNVQDIRDKALIATLYLTGGRISEVLKLYREDLSFQKLEEREYLVVKLQTLKRKKGVEERLIPIPTREPLLQYLIQWLSFVKLGQPVFYSYHNPDKPIDRHQAWRIIKKASEKLWCHLLRHGRLSELATEMTAFELQQFAGWSDVRPALYYVSLDWKQLARKIE